MKRFSVIFLLVLIQSSFISAKPKIEFKNSVISFDSVNYFSNLKFEFVFYNKGDKPLIVDSVTTSLELCALSWPKHKIASGDSGVIKAYCKLPPQGATEKNIVVKSNVVEPIIL